MSQSTGGGKVAKYPPNWGEKSKLADSRNSSNPNNNHYKENYTNAYYSLTSEMQS